MANTSSPDRISSSRTVPDGAGCNEISRLIDSSSQNSRGGSSSFRLGVNFSFRPTKLKAETLAARTRLVASGESGWSLAILVPTKKLTRTVSDAFREPTGRLPAITHDAAVDMEGAILGANIVACLMQPASPAHRFIFVQLVADYHRGKNGNEASKTSIERGTSVLNAYHRMIDFAARGRPLPGNSIMVAMMAVYERVTALALTGDPDKDWTAVRHLMENGECRHLSEIGLECDFSWNEDPV